MNNITREKDIYQILTSNNSQIGKLIRHYKIIQKRNNGDDTENKKYYLYYSANNVLCKIFDNIEDAQSYQSMLKINNNEKTYIVTKNSNNYILEQNIGSYNDNLYNDIENTLKNEYRDNAISFDKYNSIDDLQNKLIEEANNAIESYVNDINIHDTLDSSTGEIDNVINSFNDESKDYLYIRFAPSTDQSDTQIKRAFQIHNVSELYDNKINGDDHYAFKEIPVYNDNLIYSNKKCKYVEDKNLDTNTNITIRIFNDTDISSE